MAAATLVVIVIVDSVTQVHAGEPAPRPREGSSLTCQRSQGRKGRRERGARGGRRNLYEYADTN